MRSLALVLLFLCGCSGGGDLSAPDLAALTGCQKDTDCKGDRICVAGACADQVADAAAPLQDLSATVDLGEPRDVANMPDVASAPDLIAPPDFAKPSPDLTEPPADLTNGPDLTPSPDLTPACFPSGALPGKCADYSCCPPVQQKPCFCQLAGDCCPMPTCLTGDHVEEGMPSVSYCCQYFVIKNGNGHEMVPACHNLSANTPCFIDTECASGICRNGNDCNEGIAGAGCAWGVCAP